jgi:hypothetical protein
MTQLGFWNSIWDPMEVGWYVQWALENKVRQKPENTHTVVTKTNLAVCGYVPNVKSQWSHIHITDKLGDGNLLYLTNNQ